MWVKCWVRSLNCTQIFCVLPLLFLEGSLQVYGLFSRHSPAGVVDFVRTCSYVHLFSLLQYFANGGLSAGGAMRAVVVLQRQQCETLGRLSSRLLPSCLAQSNQCLVSNDGIRACPYDWELILDPFYFMNVTLLSTVCRYVRCSACSTCICRPMVFRGHRCLDLVLVLRVC